MAANLRDALTDLDARNAPPQSALQDLPGERLLLDATRLGLQSVFGGALQGRATFVLHDDDSGYFETPDELSQIGLIRGEDISEHLSFQDVTADLHESLRERLEAESAALEALDLDVVLEAPLAQAQGITFIGRHRVSVGASSDGGLWLLTLDEVPVPEELAALGLHMAATSAEQLWQTLQNALQNQDLINLSLPPQEAQAHPEIEGSTAAEALGLDEATAAQETPRIVTVLSAHLQMPVSSSDQEWDEDEAPTCAIPALKLDASRNFVEQSALLDPKADVAEPFEFEDVSFQLAATSPHAVHGEEAPSMDETVPPAPPPADSMFDLDEEEGAEEVPAHHLNSPELAMPDVGELEFPASAVDMSPVPELAPETPAAQAAAGATIESPLADAAFSSSDVKPEVNGAGQAASAFRTSAPPAKSTHDGMPLAAVIGDGIASGKTGAIELNADAFAALGREDLDMAESLEREAAILEARVIELRANAKRLRARHANLAELFGLRSVKAEPEPELSISEWAAGELPSDMSALEQAALPEAMSPSVETDPPALDVHEEPVADPSDTFAIGPSQEGHSASPYPEMMAPDDEQATQMVEMRASAFESLRKQTPEAISNVESATSANAEPASEAEARTQAIVRPDLGGSISYERAVDDALANLEAASPENVDENMQEAVPDIDSEDLGSDDSTRQQDAELEAALSQEFDLESRTAGAPVAEPEASSEPLPASSPDLSAQDMSADVPRPSKVALVVDDARARERLQKYLHGALGEMNEAATLADAYAQLDLSQIGSLVVVRPKADEATLGALSAIASTGLPISVLILSSDARFDGVAGVSLRLELARRASEVADQVVQGLQQLGVVTNHG